MLNALLDAVCAADDTVEQHDDSHVQRVTETKVPKAAESDSTLIFPPSCENAMGLSLSQTPKTTNALLTNAEMVAGKEEDMDGSDAGSDWDDDAPEPPTTSADRLTGGNMNIENDGVVTIGLTPRGNVENKALKHREEKSDTIADSDLDQGNDLVQALKQLPGIASPDEARNWGPVPWGRFTKSPDSSSPSWSFPLLQSAISEVEPLRTNLLNPAVVASREAIRRRAIIFSPLNVDPRNSVNNGSGRSYPRVAYDWREAQESVGSSTLKSKPVATKIKDHSDLKFDSRFECGNLLRAVQIAPFEYDLFVRADVNTKSYMQWWYFAVKGTHPKNWKDLAIQKANKRKEHAWGGVNSSGVNIARLNRSREPTSLGVNPSGSVTIKFNIVNLCKPDSMYNKGMQPVLYSCFEAENAGIGWRRAGSDICYFGNQYARVDAKGNHYTLTFKITFQNPNDTVLLAHSPPYTYTDNLRHLKNLTLNRGSCIKRTVLCKTLAERQCDLLTITDFETQEDPKKRRRAIVITARVHPGETPASWIMKGFLDFITGASSAAKMLRKMFVFKVVPMLNPDGVFYGNNRCNLSGVDLNRQWSYPSPLRHPTVFHTKKMIRELRASRPVILYLDIHAHSRKNNIFMYGVEEKNRPTPSRRIIPLLMSKGLFSHKYFSYRDCHFKVTSGRESTARVVVARELHIANSYTVESTYCGSNQGPMAGQQFNVGHLEIFGMGIADTILQLYHTDAEKRGHLQKCLALLQGSLYHKNSNYSNNKRHQREEEAAEKASAFISENNPGENGQNVESLIFDKGSPEFNYNCLKDMGEKLGLGLGKVTSLTQRRSSDSFLYTNFRENKFAEAAAFENFEIYKEVFSPTIPKDSSKKGKSYLKRNSKSSSKTSAPIAGRIKPRSRTKSKSLPQGNKYCGQSDSSSEKLHIEDFSSNDEPI